MFSVDTLVTIDLGAGAEKATCFSRIRGWREDKYVILDLPMAGGKPIYLHQKKEYIFRYIEDGVYWGFRSWVIENVFKPFPFTIIRYPTDAEHRSLRAMPRYKTNLEATFKCEGFEGKGTILDLSLQGCLLTAEEPGGLEVGRVIVIMIHCPSQDNIHNLTGAIRNVTSKDDRFLAGVSFHQTPKALAELVQMIAQFSA
ncbi:MAG: flagellar brake protein [Deltaproteobacteria bacterium]|nr:flagellar brake protein [Deltaproteobacteria bacterium]